ncbi:DeoR/GlpR family DNA-binding transcription regulator [Shimia haliotis]|uniref:Transcriptional regulator, DeoR family n=1 Tax=Shimia haliotis TaxID=1280847 RepID=A0A1I4CZL6_9RHOB|nr:DeoR/GlpR family DNA-binding transcription regulator [Shimia haliotis]SFK86050.1 transcriptional regulator, DeoR family [Shimia haliotis]
MKSRVTTKARQAEILKLLKRDGRAIVDSLAELLETTPQTIRKDLNALARDNQIIRFHGGATLAAGTEYASFDVRCEIQREEKDLIGAAVAAEIPNHSNVILNGGTTTLAVARHLVHHVGLKVVVDSVNLANELRSCVGVQVIVPSGIVRHADGAILGASAVEFIRKFRADVAVVGAAGVGADGTLADYDLEESAVSSAIIASGRNVVLAADSSKFGKLAPLTFGSISDVDTLVTDRHFAPEMKAMADQNDVRFVVGR